MQRSSRVYLKKPIYTFSLLALALAVAVLVVATEPPTLSAQPGPMATCGAQIRAALTTAISYCETLGRNQACYGHTLGAVSMRNEAEPSPWVNVGDVADLTRIRGVSLSPMDTQTGDWGVALMEVQGSLPDTLPGQNVTVVAFGDVALEDTVNETVRIPAQVLASANVRVKPSVGSWVIGGLAEGEAITVTGQATTAAGEVWLQVKYDGYRTRTGWVLASLVNVGGQPVPTVSENSLVYGNMQAFYLRTGLGVPQCAELSSSGVILQTPEDAGLVSININGVDLSLGSTAFISLSGTGASSTLDITLLEGHSLVESMGEERVLIPGSRTSVTLDPSGHAAGSPSEAVDYQPLAMEPYNDLLRDLSVELPAPAGDFNDEWDSDINGDFGEAVGYGTGVNRPGTQPNPPGANPPLPGSNGAPQEWNENASCDNPPPAHAPANGWRQRCENSGGGDNGGNNGGGNGNGGNTNGNGNGNGNENGNGGGNDNGNGGGNGNGNGNGGGNGNGNGNGNGGGNGNGNGNGKGGN